MMPMVNHFFLSSLPYTLGVVVIWFLIAYWANTSIINSATCSKPLDRKENKRVYNLVENLCMSQGMNMPKINIIYDDSLNAFASGINDRTYTITLSRGIIQKLNDEELEAVIGHELTHIRNRDVRLLIISIVFVGIFSMLGGALASNDLGINQWLTEVLGPMFSDMSWPVFVLLIVVVCTVVTNFFSNMPTGLNHSSLTAPFAAHYADPRNNNTVNSTANPISSKYP